MVLLMALVPVYVLIGAHVRHGVLHAPALAIDLAVPLTPGWVLGYGPLYLFLIVLPPFIVREQALLERTFWAYLSVWLIAYAVFLAYPTVAPRPTTVAGTNFAAWGLRFLYAADPPLNCFPSLHVAHSFVSAFATLRVNRQLGAFALVAATLVGVSTLFTKQHYVADVVAGALLGYVAILVFFRGYPRARVPESDTQLAPFLAIGVAGLVSIVFLGYVAAYVADLMGIAHFP